MQTMQSFVHETRASRVFFGPGTRRFLSRELDQLGVRRALVLTTPEQTELGQEIAAILGDRCAGVLGSAVMHVPIEVARSAI
ncbi:maleylacetate reductase, partial [Paraburkholderia sediminicola]